MPTSLLEALQNHPKLSNRVALFTCWGLNEDRLVTESLAPDRTQLGGNGSWLATQNFDDLDLDEWAVEIVDEVAAVAERKLRGWVRGVEVPFDPPADRQEQLQREERLKKEG